MNKRMTPQKMMDRLDRMAKAVLKNRSDDIQTKYEVKSMFEYLKKLIKYQVPMPPEASDDGFMFRCPRCKQVFESGEGFTADDFFFCPSCGQRFKEGTPLVIDEDEGEENGN